MVHGNRHFDGATTRLIAFNLPRVRYQFDTLSILRTGTAAVGMDLQSIVERCPKDDFTPDLAMERRSSAKYHASVPTRQS